MEIEEHVNQNKQISKENGSYMDKMKKIYDSIIKDPILKKHINLDRDERIKYIQNFPFDNLPHNETFYFNNICMFNELACVYGYVNVNDYIKAIDFEGNYKVNEKTTISQRCLLPENLFYQKFENNNIIFPLNRKELKKYWLK